MSWIPLTSDAQVAEIIEKSRTGEKPIVVFKHSTRCGTSMFAKRRLQNSDAFRNNDFDIYYLDLLKYRSISNHLAEAFGVEHQSPQILFIQDGECVFHASHGAIDEGVFAKSSS